MPPFCSLLSPSERARASAPESITDDGGQTDGTGGHAQGMGGLAGGNGIGGSNGTGGMTGTGAGGAATDAGADARTGTGGMTGAGGTAGRAGTGGATGTGGMTGTGGAGGMGVMGTTLFPRPGGTNLCPDPTLRITFSGAPTVGTAGKIQIFNAASPGTAVASSTSAPRRSPRPSAAWSSTRSARSTSMATPQ